MIVRRGIEVPADAAFDLGYPRALTEIGAKATSGN